MPIRTKIELNGRMVDGEEMEFTPIREEWSVYDLSDGTKVKIKTVVTKIIKTNERHPRRNDPIFSIVSTNVVDAIVPESEKIEDES